MKNKPKKKRKKKCIAGGWRQYEMLTIFSYITLDSPESAAKSVVLMKNMSDGFSRAVLCVERAVYIAFKRGGQSPCCKTRILLRSRAWVDFFVQHSGQIAVIIMFRSSFEHTTQETDTSISS